MRVVMHASTALFAGALKDQSSGQDFEAYVKLVVDDWTSN